MPLPQTHRWLLGEAVTRWSYLEIGLALVIIKYAIDALVAWLCFGVGWTPLNYLIWPSDRTVNVFSLAPADQRFALTMTALSLPFVALGVYLTVGRLRDAGLPSWLVLFFFVPLVNLLLFAVLVVLPSKAIAEPKSPDRWQQAHNRMVGDSRLRRGAVPMIVVVPLTVAGVFAATEYFKSYGFGVFVAGPFAIGMISSLLYGFSRPQPFSACLTVALLSITAAGIAILFVGIEGAICLWMASPIVFTLAFMGAVVGYVIQSRPWLVDHSALVSIMLVVVVPFLIGAEAINEPVPAVRWVVTVVEIDAPPESVWPLVIAFPPLAEPDDWMFRAGVAYPLRATIDGVGPGAVRHCVFSTGAFVEPIDVWDAPNLLRFRVTDQPAPMREWSPYSIHPPHLDHYLVSQQGQFKLDRLPDGRTRLEGTTWYTNRMWPAPYWGLWSDAMIHKIHGRVLEHIRQLAERDDLR